MKRIAEEFIGEFEKRYGHLECSVLRDKYRDPVIGCETTVRMAARVLEEIIQKYRREITYRGKWVFHKTLDAMHRKALAVN